jgi:P4 family phage/plasmid primase-like protien
MAENNEAPGGTQPLEAQTTHPATGDSSNISETAHSSKDVCPDCNSPAKPEGDGWWWCGKCESRFDLAHIEAVRARKAMVADALLAAKAKTSSGNGSHPPEEWPGATPEQNRASTIAANHEPKSSDEAVKVMMKTVAENRIASDPIEAPVDQQQSNPIVAEEVDVDALMGRDPTTLTDKELAAVRRRMAEDVHLREIAGDGAADAAEKLRKVMTELQALNAHEYAMVRMDLAKKHHVSVTTLDEIYEVAHPQKKKRFTPGEKEGELPVTDGGSLINAIVERHLGKQSTARELKTRRNMTEAGNAARFIDMFGSEIRYNHTLARWLLWDGRRWASDEAGRIGFLVAEALRSIYAEAGDADTEEEREALAKWAIKSERAAISAAVLKLAPSEPAIAVTSELLDTDLWLLNVNNGTLDLRTGKLHAPAREDNITMLAPVTFDPDAKAPLWDDFVKEMLPDEEVRQFTQTLAGYCLTGDTTAQIFPIAFGDGRNGKTTLFQTIREMLGDYGGDMTPDALTAAKYSDGGKAANPQVAETKGKRMIVASETTTGTMLDVGLVKVYTGGENIKARFLHSNPVTFKPTAKLILFTNHKPKIPDTDLGIWRRVKLIPFEVTLAEDKQDRGLHSKLCKQWPGILNWCMDGLERYQEKGLEAPKKIMEATGLYKESEDVVGSFIADECEVGEHFRARSSALFKRFQKWCEAENERTGTSRDFKAALEGKGHHQTRDGIGVLFLGLRMRPEAVNATPSNELPL